MIPLHEPSSTINTEKRDLLEVLEELGMELEERGTSDRPYYVGLCPLHRDTSPSFVVFPRIQRCVCYSCVPEGMDVYGFYMRYKGVDFPTAKKAMSIAVPAEVVIENMIAKQLEPKRLDRMIYAKRMNKLFNKHDFDKAINIFQRVDVALNGNRAGEADMILRRMGV